MKYRIAKWAEYQHYSKRNPPWIKLHTSLLTSRTWVSLDDASRVLAVACMLLASKSGGEVDGDGEYVRRVAYLNQSPDFRPLVSSGFLEPLSPAPQSSETETETEKLADASKMLAAGDEVQAKPKKARNVGFKGWTRQELVDSVAAANADGLLTADQAADFVGYWCEPSATGRERFKLEPTWDTRRRMKTALEVVYSRRQNGGNLSYREQDKARKEAENARPIFASPDPAPAGVNW